jgi:hypothetical protein
LPAAARYTALEAAPEHGLLSFLPIRESAMRRLFTRFAVVTLSLIAASSFAAAEEAAVLLGDSPAHRAIEERLAKPIDLEFDNAPLSDLVSWLRETTRLNLQLDNKALEEAGILADAPVTINLKGISLRSGLNLILRDREMTWVIHDDVLLLSTEAQAETILETTIYPVADLVAPPATSDTLRSRQSPDFHTLIDVISAIIAPSGWSDVGGSGTILFDRRTKSLVVSQTVAVHEQIAALLADLRAARDQQFFPERAHAAAKPPLDQIARARIERALSAEVTLDMEQVPLMDVIQKLAIDAKLPIIIDRKSFEEAGIATDTAITFHVKDVPLRQALRRLLDPTELEFVIRDEVLLITTDPQAETILPVRVYPAFDLARSSGGSRQDYESVTELIVRTLAPSTWAEVGGPGSIKAVPNAGALVISQTDKVQEEVVALLAAMRKVQSEEQAAAPADGKQPDRDDAAAADELILVVHRLPMQISESFPHGMGGMGGGMFQVPAENQQAGALTAPAASGEQKKPAESGQTRPTHPADIMAARQAARANAARDLETIIPRVIAPESWQKAGGKGSIHAFGDKLIVRQTRSIHDQIDDLLDEL